MKTWLINPLRTGFQIVLMGSQACDNVCMTPMCLCVLSTMSEHAPDETRSSGRPPPPLGSLHCSMVVVNAIVDDVQRGFVGHRCGEGVGQSTPSTPNDTPQARLIC